MWYPLGYDEVDNGVYEREESTEEDEMLEYEDESSILSELSDLTNKKMYIHGIVLLEKCAMKKYK